MSEDAYQKVNDVPVEAAERAGMPAANEPNFGPAVAVPVGVSAFLVCHLTPAERLAIYAGGQQPQVAIPVVPPPVYVTHMPENTTRH